MCLSALLLEVFLVQTASESSLNRSICLNHLAPSSIVSGRPELSSMAPFAS